MHGTLEEPVKSVGGVQHRRKGQQRRKPQLHNSQDDGGNQGDSGDKESRPAEVELELRLAKEFINAAIAGQFLLRRQSGGGHRLPGGDAQLSQLPFNFVPGAIGCRVGAEPHSFDAPQKGSSIQANLPDWPRQPTGKADDTIFR